MNLPTDIHLALENMSAYQLANAIGVDIPDSLDSAGATFLGAVRDAFVDAFGDVDADDMSSLGDTMERAASDIADDAPDAYDHARWAQYVDLCAWKVDLSDVGITSVRVDNLTRDLAGPALSFLAEQLLAWLINYTSTEYQTAVDGVIAHAEGRGAADGRNAAEWWAQANFGGRAPGDVAPLAARVIAGIEDIDPDILDTLPRADLSGEWADGRSLQDILGDRGMGGVDVLSGDVEITVASSYEDAFAATVEEYLLTVARSVVAATDLTPDTMTRDQLLAYVAEHGIKTSEGRIRVDPELLDTHLLRAAVAAHTAA